MYLIRLPPDLMKALWELREYYQKGPIVQQVRDAVERYVAALKGKQADQPKPLPFVQTQAGHLLETKYRHFIKALLKAEGIEPPEMISIRLKGGRG